MNKYNTNRMLALGLLIVLILATSYLALLAGRADPADAAVVNPSHVTDDRPPSETIDLTTIHPADRKFYDPGYLDFHRSSSEKAFTGP